MKVQICTGRACRSKFSNYLVVRLENDKQKFELKKLKIEETLCMGQCKYGPNAKIDDGDMVNHTEPAKLSAIVMGNNKQSKNTNNKKNKKHAKHI